MSKTVLAIKAIILLLLSHLPAFSDELRDRSGHMLLDESASATLSDVIDESFTPFSGAIARGYTKSALWIRMRIPESNDGENWAILVRPAFLKRVELYDPSLRGNTAPPLFSGRDAPTSADTHIGLDNGFIIPSSRDTRDIYLRITSNTTLTVDITVLPASEANRLSFVAGGLVAAYFSFILGFGLWGLITWTLRGDTLYALFAARQFFASTHIFVYFGLLRFFFSGFAGADARDLIYVLATCTVGPAGGIFDVRLVSEFGGSRRLRYAIYAVLSVPVLTIPLALLGHTQTALQVGTLFVNIQMLLLVMLSFTASSDQSRPLGVLSLRLVRVGYIIMAAVVTVPIFMYLNVLQTSVPLFKMIFLHAAISTIVLFGLLSIRNRQRDLAEQEARLLLSFKEAELREESNRRQEKESFLSMLTHELRNPLSIIQIIAEGDNKSAIRLQKAARDMANVIDRVEQSEMIDGGKIHLEQLDFDFTDLIEKTVSSHVGIVLDVQGPQIIHSDPRLLQHILENLLDNAKKYCASGTEIRVQVETETVAHRTGVVFRVSNVVGEAGIPDLDRVFAKYYRAKRAHRKPGSGLGLFLVDRWVSALDGTVQCLISDEGEGVRMITFIVWVPK